MKKTVPFFENFDDNHCLQACIFMVLEYFFPKKFTWDDIERFTDYENGLWTWAPKGVVSLGKLINGVKYFSRADYVDFAKRGAESSLVRNWGDEWRKKQEEHSTPGFKKEQSAAREMIKLGFFRKEQLTIEDLIRAAKRNFLIALVDWGALHNRKPDYSGHRVLVYGTKASALVIHDPGLPPFRDKIVDKNTFSEAFRGGVILIPKSVK